MTYDQECPTPKAGVNTASRCELCYSDFFGHWTFGIGNSVRDSSPPAPGTTRTFGRLRFTVSTLFSAAPAGLARGRHYENASWQLWTTAPPHAWQQIPSRPHPPHRKLLWEI